MEILLRIKTIMQEIKFIQKVIRYIEDIIFEWKDELQKIVSINTLVLLVLQKLWYIQQNIKKYGDDW
jgi:hypothetical protein